nr:MAG TPA: TNF receptor-associated factor 6 zinc finger 2 [Bacteriophage sp.]
MVNITLRGPQWLARMECSQCGISRIEQAHPHTKPWVAVESTIKTTARTLGWHVGSRAAVCRACRRAK